MDDEPAVLRLLQAILEARGYEVTPVSGGRQALELCLSPTEQFDVLLTDVTMPDMNGRELVAALEERQIAIPVLFMTGYDSARDSEDGMDEEVGDERYATLRKPFTPTALTRAVETLLAKTHSAGGAG